MLGAADEIGRVKPSCPNSAALSFTFYRRAEGTGRCKFPLLLSRSDSSGPVFKIMINTVEQIKKFLDGKIKKCKNFSTDKFISSLFEDEHGFNRAKAGVGRETILKFLNGDGETWKHGEIQFALDSIQSIEANELDRKGF